MGSPDVLGLESHELPDPPHILTRVFDERPQSSPCAPDGRANGSRVPRRGVRECSGHTLTAPIAQISRQSGPRTEFALEIHTQRVN